MSLSIRSMLLLLVAFSTSAKAGDVSVRLDSGAGFSVNDATGAVERLRVDEATGNVSRNGALFVHTTGANSVFVGQSAGNLSNIGRGNTALGAKALAAIGAGLRNTAVGSYALFSNTSGNNNSAFGETALIYNTAGHSNTAVGEHAMASNTTGSLNAAVGRDALTRNTTGGSNAAFGAYALKENNSTKNSAFGYSALRQDTTGFYNSAFGADALRTTSTSGRNSAFGRGALRLTTSGSYNAAFGEATLENNTTGSFNTALGRGALFFNTTGVGNTAVGQYALLNNSTGQDNVAVGRSAGSNHALGSNNIYLQNAGNNEEDGQIKIGTAGTHTGATIAGIRGATSAGGIAVLVSATGKLGTTTSSARFKQDVRDMGDASAVLMRLRPVSFRYTEEAVGEEEARTSQYGLIAEEVATVAPELVAPDLEGRPYSVKYHELPALLLGQSQQQQRTIEAQARLLAEQRELIAALAARVGRIESR